MSKAQAVDLSNVPRPNVVEDLNKALKKIRGPVSLLLTKCELRWGVCGKIAAVLDDHPKALVVSFDISHNPIGTEGAIALCQSKTLFREVVEFRMTHCLVESDAGAVIASCIRSCYPLKFLDLSDNDLGSLGVGSLGAKGVNGNCNLEELVLCRNNVGDVGAIGLARGLISHPALLTLTLTENEIGPDGCAALGEALSSRALPLSTLNLGSNQVQRDGCKGLETMLLNNASLVSLNIENNCLGGSKLDAVLILSTSNDGVSKLAKALTLNQYLLYLNMATNKVGKAGMRTLGEFLGSNKTLGRFLFDDQDHVELIESGIRHNRSVTDLGCAPTPGIEKALAKNKKERDAFLKGIHAGMAVTQIKKYLDKGIDVYDEEDGPLHLIKGVSPEILTYFLTVPRIRNYLLSTRKLFQELPLLPAGSLKVLARAKGPNTCFLVAARLGDLRALKLMLKAGASINSQKDFMERTALHLATEHGHEHVVEHLLKAGADPNIPLWGLSLVLLAAKNGFVRLLRMLVKRFPDMLHSTSPKLTKDTPPKKKGRTALHVAAKSGRYEVCEALLELGLPADILSHDGRTPLMMASTPEICKLLLDNGASIKATDPDGLNVLYLAMFPENSPVAKPNLDVITFLLENHADKKAAFEAVKELNLNNLYRDSLPVWIGQLPNLQAFEAVEGNSLRSIPRIVVEGGDPAVLNYLRDMTGGKKDEWVGFKIMVLGKEGVGKTHIFHLASGKVYPRNASTDGIDIHNFNLGEAQVPVTWFDFGGQEVFYPTHELFLTGQCVYLLAFKMNDPEYEKRVSYWLKVVATFSMDRAKVVIVGTHKDMLPNPDAGVAEVNARIDALTANSTTVVEKIYISCLDDPKEMGDLISNSLLAAAQQARLGGKEVPHIYNVIKDWAIDQKGREKARPNFNWDDFVECFPGYDTYLLERACEFLHDMGALFLAKRFQDNKKANLVCVDVQWLAKAFSAIVTFRHNWIKAGVLRQEALTHIWRDFGIVDVNEMLAIMSLFEKFNIAFARRQDGVWIIPSMLPEAEPDVVLQKVSKEDRTHARRYQLSVVPSGAFGQIMARVSEWVDVKVVCMWRFGILLLDANDYALLTVDHGSEINLNIFPGPEDMSESVVEEIGTPSSTGVGSLLRRLDEELQQIFRFVFRRMNTVPLQTFILCPHCITSGRSAEEAEWLKYDDVVKMVLSGERKFVCNGENASIDLVGEDLTLGYVDAFPARQLKIDKEPLARGGFGLIYKGVMRNGSKIVVKELITEMGSEVSFFADFQREVSLMAQLHHDNLVQLYGIMLSPLRMVLEFCGEGDLLGALRKNKVKDPALCLRLAADVSRGMEFLHQLTPPLAHRDLRSPNVLLMSLKASSTTAVAKVADFGLTAAASSRLQQELLTWQWMAPEAFLGENYTETCDLYSFGMIMWEIWTGTGEIPFESIAQSEKNKKRQARDFMNDIIHKGLRPDCAPAFPPDVRELVVRLWEKDPKLRPSFATCTEVLEGLIGNVKRPKGFLKALLNRDLAKHAALAEVQEDGGPIVNISVNPLGNQRKGEGLTACVVRMSVQGDPETIWFGTTHGSIIVVDTSHHLIHQQKAHDGPVTSLCCSAVGNGNVYSGGTDGVILVWSILFPAKEKPANTFGEQETEEEVRQRLAQAAMALKKQTPTPTPPRGGGWATVTSASKTATVRAGTGGFQMGSRSPLPKSSRAASTNSSPSMSSLKGSAGHPGLMRGGSKPSVARSAPVTQITVKCTKPDVQPHAGVDVPVHTMVTLPHTGVLVAGDANGLLSVWSADHELLFDSSFEGPIQAMCAEGDSRIWVSANELVVLEIQEESGDLKQTHAFKADHPSGFSGLVALGDQLHAADGANIKVFDTKSMSVHKVLSVPAGTDITALSAVSVMGKRTVWSGCAGQITVWDAKALSSIKSYVAKHGTCTVITEAGENSAVVGFRDASFLFDLNVNRIED